MVRRLLIFAVTSWVVLAAAAPPGEAAHLYVAPTLGVWKWEKETAAGPLLSDRSGMVYGIRAGYAPIDAFSGEVVFLTGTNNGGFEAPAGAFEHAVRLTQIELSFLVNFQSLVPSPVYPFLDLGSGISIRGKGGTVDGKELFDDTHVAFHIGGGLKADLGPRLGLRANVRDTFFTETEGNGDQGNQITVDSVEFSLSLEYRIPLVRSRGPERLR